MTRIAAGTSSAKDWRSRLAGRGPLAGLAFLVTSLGMIVPIFSGLVVAGWAKLARVPFARLGFVRPASWWRSAAYGIALGVGLKLTMKALVLPLLGVEAVNATFGFVQGRPLAFLGLSLYAFVAAFNEETFFRGFLFERADTWLGRNATGATVAVVVSSALFGLLHFQQGRLGMVNAAIVAVVSGLIYLANRRRIFLLMVAHATFDIVSFAIIYLGLEQPLAHLFFRG